MGDNACGWRKAEATMPVDSVLSEYERCCTLGASDNVNGLERSEL